MTNIQKDVNNQPILSKIQEEEESRNLLEYCDLNRDENYFNFNNNRVLKILKSLQVRQKMYQGSLEDWRKYEKHSKSLTKGLESY
tara:strand:+ start:90 stop:344 length:255 start_codon:yes stop_codon:yes gene_type:complete